MAQFQLSAILEGHTDDVKALVSPFNDVIISGSRDSTVRVWHKDNGVWDSKINFAANGYINSLAFDEKDQTVISGGQDKLINLTDLYSSGVDSKFVLIGHESNVCSLDSKGEEIISGSWDSTAKVWENSVLKYTLKGHQSSVWDVKIISPGKYLTASADRTIKLWENDKEVKSYVGHTDVIRALCILPDGSGFASSSNDGTIRITKFNGELVQILSGHDSFVYSVKILDNGDFVSCGEDRTIRIWRDGKAIQVITVPSISVWSVSVLPNNDIVSGGSDGIIRVFTRDPERYASQELIKAFQKEVESIALNSSQLDESHVLSKDALNQPGRKEGQVIVVKSDVGINEAFSWSSDKWVKVGEVVSGSSNEKKQLFDGQKWDYVFDVDVREGEPPLKLPYNITENPFVAATRFLEANDLPLSFTEEVVKFITANTQGVNIGQKAEVVNPYVDSKSKILPQLRYLGFTTDNSSMIFKGIERFNPQEEASFSPEDLNEIEKSLNAKDSTKLTEIAVKIISSWSNKLPGFDILRLIVSNSDQPTSSLGDILKAGLDKSKPSYYFMTLRFLSNMFLNSKWGETIVADLPVSLKIINQIRLSDLESIEGKTLINVSNAITTLLLNYSIYSYKYKAKELATGLISKLETDAIELAKASSEAAYRIAVTYGNLIYLDKGYDNAKFGEFKSFVEQRYKEPRFSEIWNEISAI